MSKSNGVVLLMTHNRKERDFKEKAHKKNKKTWKYDIELHIIVKKTLKKTGHSMKSEPMPHRILNKIFKQVTQTNLLHKTKKSITAKI